MNPTELFSAAVRSSSDGPDVTWIGPNPFGSGLCLGFDNGTIILSVTATGYTTPPQKISPAEEAINGVAAIGTSSLAVSTRSDVTFIQIESPINHSRAVFRGGAHGVVATQSGYFIAPLGAKGLLLVRPQTGSEQEMRVTTGTERQLYFYRMTALHDSTGKETLVFANRRNGVGLSEFKGDEGTGNVHTLAFEGLDVVDVCAVSPGSLSAIAISPNAEVLWVRDTSMRDDPVAKRLGGIEGRVYRVLATGKHLFVLSSKALYVWANLVSKVLYNATAAPKSHPLVLPLEAVDMSLYGDEYVLLVMAANAIMSLKISDLEKQPFDQVATDGLPSSSIEMSRKTEVEDFVPDWERHDVQQGVLAETK
jgi:hypothetical protein